ncbi:hypothetical protein KM043_005741 [Ampulex compressa]|nr:hypothetical protein KM043_005741 [Ampulex compressa]
MLPPPWLAKILPPRLLSLGVRTPESDPRKFCHCTGIETTPKAASKDGLFPTTTRSANRTGQLRERVTSISTANSRNEQWLGQESLTVQPSKDNTKDNGLSVQGSQDCRYGYGSLL